VRAPGAAVAGGLLVLGLAAPAGCAVVAGEPPVIAEELRGLAPGDRASVIVELRVAGAGDRAAAIARAQQQVLAALGPEHAQVKRRFESVPMLALEIDGEALARLATLGDLVARVHPDATRRPQGGAPR
jgi:hypothetical protein